MIRTTRAAGDTSLSRVATRPLAGAERTARTQFSGQLRAALGRESQPAGSAAVVRQDSVTGQNSAAASLSQAPSAPQQAVAALEAAMRKRGLAPEAMRLTYSEQSVSYPGGAYMNRLITADFGGGRTEQYMADLVLRNPDVAAVEMARMLGRSA